MLDIKLDTQWKQLIERAAQLVGVRLRGALYIARCSAVMPERIGYPGEGRFLKVQAKGALRRRIKC